MDFKKTEIASKLSSFGFSDVDNAALLKLNMITEALIFNMLNNVLYVTTALGVKTIKKAHFGGVLKILKDCANRCEKQPRKAISKAKTLVKPSPKSKSKSNSKSSSSSKQTGGTVLPSEYFGIDSGRYFDDVMSHDTAYLDDLTRGPLYVQEAGASSSSSSSSKKGTSSASSSFITPCQIKEIITKYKQEMDVDFKVAKDVYAIVEDSVNSNMIKLLLACAVTKQAKLTTSLLLGNLNQSKSLFSHMARVYN